MTAVLLMTPVTHGVLAASLLVLTALSARVALAVGSAARVRVRLPTRGAARPPIDPVGRRDWRSGGHRRLGRDLPDALEDVARSLRSGTSLRVALAEAAAAGSGPARRDLATVVDRVTRGVPLGEALDEWSAQRGSSDVHLAVAALALGIEAGAPSARAVDAVAATLRDRLAVAGDVAAQAAQARLSALVIALLPLGFTSWACLTDRRVARFLFVSPAGWACLAAGVGLNVIGAVWMARIVRSVR